MSSSLTFSKMHGLCNDFMVIDGVRQSVDLSAVQIAAWADRHCGIGFDQLLLVQSPSRTDVLFDYRIFNADGSEVEHCGNGARCFAEFVFAQGLTSESNIPVQTRSGRLVLHRLAVEDTPTGESGWVKVSMGEPVFEPVNIPFQAHSLDLKYPLVSRDGETLMVGTVSMGNPHVVILVQDVDTAPVVDWGTYFESHEAFPNRVNVSFLQVVNTDQVRLRVFERGVGETQACGTGACAAVVIARSWGLVNERVNVTLPGGVLQVQWSGVHPLTDTNAEEAPVWLTGPTQTVFTGTVCV